tara:strand:- start:57 stop:632 length:576 start_codon:yes stop_codon:yes gene_type:complete
MRKVFIDGGAHGGQSIRRFVETCPDATEYEVHSFEPNPYFKEKILGYQKVFNVHYHPKALWVEDGTIDFFGTDEIDKSKYCGCTVTEEKQDVSHAEPITVECINLGQWIKKTFSKEDKIYLKLDIEGAEYKVLNSMIDNGSIFYPDKLFVEFHHQWMEMDPQIHFDLQKRLKENNIEVQFWDALGSFVPKY